MDRVGKEVGGLLSKAQLPGLTEKTHEKLCQDGRLPSHNLLYISVMFYEPEFIFLTIVVVQTSFSVPRR